MQFVGKEDVRKIASAVSVSTETIGKAAYYDAQMLITHHGLFWNTEPRAFDKRQQTRILWLEALRMSLLGYHLALDAHPMIGNNILAVRNMGGTKNVVPFTDLGWGAEVEDPQMVMPLIEMAYDRDNIKWFKGGPPKINKVCAITGSGGHYIHAAAKEGYDLFLTGEAEEPSKALAKELGIHFVAAGHYQTEKAGIQALGDLIAKEFGIKHEFVEVNNPV
jgi:dinuclear metal center YbgI/SA1388 family protein